MAKKKPKREKIIPFELKGLFFLVLSLLLFLSLLSFAFFTHSHNWVGAIGYTVGWLLHMTFGLGSYLVVLFVGWLGWTLLLGREIPHLSSRLIAFVVFLSSLSLLLSLLEVISPTTRDFIGGILFAGPYHLGGLPYFYLFHELPAFNLYSIFNSVGVAILFSTLGLISLLFLLDISIASLLEKKAIVKTEPEKKEPIRVRLPLQMERQIEREDLPSPPKEVTISLPKMAEEGLLPKKNKREAALQAQAIWNGDFKNYELPGAELLTIPKQVDQTTLKKDLKRQAEVLEETLLSFGLEAKVGQINCGPTITSFELHPSVGVKVQKIKALENDIALNMQAASIRIIAPIPGKAAVGVEVPNPQPQEVGFREILTAYLNGETKFRIPLLLGKGVSGDYVMSDLAKMPHVIIAGATGSGKSVCINTIVMSIVFTAKPDEVQLLMVDPKKVELTPYSSLPHMIAPVITSPQEAYTAMQWLVKEMEKRYDLLNRLHYRNIDSFNTRTINKEKEAELNMDVPAKLPYIVGIIDELADLMMVSTYDIETPITRIAQMARAVGIHLVLATQRPSREVITGLIKANFPSRICFKVSSAINSKIVIDSNGGEQLLGNGDMLFLPPGSSNLDRVQGAYIRDKDIQAVIAYVTSIAPTNYRIPSFNNVSSSMQPDLFDPPANERDVLYDQALDVVLSTRNASTTFLQRKLKVGYARAASLMDQLEAAGVVSAPDGSKARTVLSGKRRDDELADEEEEE